MQSELPLTSEEDEHLGTLLSRMNSLEKIDLSSRSQKNESLPKSSSIQSEKNSDGDKKMIELTSPKLVKCSNELEPNKEIPDCIKITQKMEDDNSENLALYSLKLSKNLKPQKKKNVVAEKILSSDTIKNLPKRSKAKESRNLVFAKSELIQLYVNKSSGKKELGDSEVSDNEFVTEVQSAREKRKISKPADTEQLSMSPKV